MIEAFPTKDGSYRLHGNTYYLRKKIKSLGGIWDGRWWIVPEGILSQINAVKMVMVGHDAHCHEDAGYCYASEKELEVGEKRMGCAKCDKPYICGDLVKIWPIQSKAKEKAVIE